MQKINSFIHSIRENNFLISIACNISFWIGAFFPGSEDLFWSDFSENNFTNLSNRLPVSV